MKNNLRRKKIREQILGDCICLLRYVNRHFHGEMNRKTDGNVRFSHLLKLAEKKYLSDLKLQY
jgi:hypothetical protein